MGKTFKDAYRQSRAVDRSCRCHGTGSWCRNNRMQSTKKRRNGADEQIREFVEERAHGARIAPA
jgi:hypothetical protein